jgi:hypothetical protein
VIKVQSGSFISIAILVFFCIFCLNEDAFGETINVSNTSELRSAVSFANSSGGKKDILLEDGIYTLQDTLYIKAPYVTIGSQSGIRENVIIQGDAMDGNAKVGNVIYARGNNFKLQDVTLQKCRWHLIQVAAADFTVIKNCILRDAYQQLLKVTQNVEEGNKAENGLIENCLFEYSAGVGPQFYIGGIDAHAAKNWKVSGNTFRSIISPSIKTAEFAIHFWNNSANNIVEKNLIIDCDRGIGFGIEGMSNSGGIIRNNIIYHAKNRGQFGDTGIAMTESPNTWVYNNTVFMEHDFSWAIEYRFKSTQNVKIINNLTNKPIQARNDATGIVENNLIYANANWFVNPAQGDLHLANGSGPMIDSSVPVSGLEDDFDGESRPKGNGIDIGADEFCAKLVPPRPNNLRATQP